MRKAKSAGVLLSDGSLGQLGFDVADEQAQYLAEGEVGVTEPCLGVAGAVGNEQVSVGFLRTASELGDQGGLAGAGLAGDETHLGLTGQDAVEKLVQLCEFVLACDKDLLSHRHFLYYLLSILAVLLTYLNAYNQGYGTWATKDLLSYLQMICRTRRHSVSRW